MATASSIFTERMRKAFAAVGIGVRSSATQADSSVPTIKSGSGAPSATEPAGSLYMRTGTGALYTTTGGGSWSANAAGSDFGATGLLTDVVAESTGAAGVTVDGLLIKDAAVAPVVGGAAWANLSACATGEADTILADNLADAWTLRESTTPYLTVVTSNDLERVNFKKILALPEVITIDMADAAHAIVLGTAGAAQTKLLGNVVLCDANSAGTEALTLPTAANCDGLVIIIHNTGGEDITFPDIASLTLSTTEMAIVTCDGTSWRGGVLKLT